MIEKIKDMYYYLSFEWDFKSFAKQYPIIVIFFTFLFWQLREGAINWWWVTPTLFALAPFVIFIADWLIRVKPLVRELEREAERREKYSWMYERFTKHER